MIFSIFAQRYPKCIDRKADEWEARIEYRGAVTADTFSQAIAEAKKQGIFAPIVQRAAH